MLYPRASHYKTIWPLYSRELLVFAKRDGHVRPSRCGVKQRIRSPASVLASLHPCSRCCCLCCALICDVYIPNTLGMAASPRTPLSGPHSLAGDSSFNLHSAARQPSTGATEDSAAHAGDDSRCMSSSEGPDVSPLRQRDSNLLLIDVEPSESYTACASFWPASAPLRDSRHLRPPLLDH